MEEKCEICNDVYDDGLTKVDSCWGERVKVCDTCLKVGKQQGTLDDDR